MFIEQKNRYKPAIINEKNQYNNRPLIKSNVNTQPVNIVNKRKENNLDNNDVKQVVYKKDKNENVISKEKPKNYVVSNEGFVKNNNNNKNKEEKKEENRINKETKPVEEITIKQEIKVEPKEEKQENKEEKKERKKIENKTFLDVYSYFIEEQYNNGVIGDSRHKTYYTCHSLWNRMERYQHKQYRVKDITTATIYDFRHFVLNECDLWEMRRVKDDKTGEMVDKLMPKKQYDYIYQGYEIMKSRGVEKRSLNYVVIQVKYLKAFWHWLMKIKKVGVEDIFLTYNMDQAVYGTPYYFTKKDREILYKADFSDSPELAIQRDIFVFQSLVGCRVGDLKRLKKSNIIDGEVLQYVAGKTKNKSGKIVTVPLHPIAQEIIKRYSIIEGDQLLPFIADQNYNEAIKKMFKKVDKIDHVVTVLDPVTRLEKQVKLSEVASSHMGRRNFCGNLYEAGYRDADIASMSGHAEGSRAIARYRKVSDERKKKMIKSL